MYSNAKELGRCKRIMSVGICKKSLVDSAGPRSVRQDFLDGAMSGGVNAIVMGKKLWKI